MTDKVPTDICLDVPNTKYTSVGKKAIYKPELGVTPANKPYAIPRMQWNDNEKR